jgi:pimeloyl-ACP methyl ester carboxylesterase
VTARPSPDKRADGFLHRRVDVGEVTLHVAEARPRGDAADVPDDVPLVVFLHGFPELWWSWRHQLRAFAGAGFWAVAPDMRGYNESDKPVGIEHYEVEKLAGDVAGLIRALGRKQAIVVGHDWGAHVAWTVAQFHPEVVSRLAILNVPHPLQMARGLATPKQLKKSWYMFFFQLPLGLPEKALAAGNFAALRKTFEVDGFATSEIDPYVDAMRRPGAVTAALSYYRAAVRRGALGRSPKTRVIEHPVLVIWGDQDRHLGKELAAPPARFVPNARVEHIPLASHWVQNAAPERVNELLLAFAREGAASHG